MLRSGIREIEIIAQDTTRYGTDLNDGESMLFELLERLEDLNLASPMRGGDTNKESTGGV